MASSFSRRTTSPRSHFTPSSQVAPDGVEAASNVDDANIRESDVSKG
jgi:hypothetical protein